MKNITGQPVRGENFYQRPREIAKITKGIRSGSHLQIAAPRRVGKTSILLHFQDQGLDHFVFANTESINSSQEYFRRLYKELLESPIFKKDWKTQLKTRGNAFLHRLKGFSFLEAEIEFTEGEDIDYCEEFQDLIKGIDLGNEKIIFMVDEFPVTVQKILESEDKVADAVSFLHKNRAIRQDPQINNKLQFIYTGSIGLTTVVSNLGATATINDLDAIGVAPLTEEEAKELSGLILSEEKYQIGDSTISYLLQKIDWLIPFHIQLILKEVMELVTAGNQISEKDVDNAFDQLLDHNKNQYFEHYESRLKSSFKSEELRFAHEVLAVVAKNTIVNLIAIKDLATKYEISRPYRYVLDTLVYDGYIHSDQSNNFQFNSPLVRLWWIKNICN